MKFHLFTILLCIGLWNSQVVTLGWYYNGCCLNLEKKKNTISEKRYKLTVYISENDGQL